MTMRLLFTTAIGLALGTAAFAQTAADPSKTAPTNPPAAQAAPTSTQTNATQPASIRLSAGVSVTEPDRNRISESVARMSVKPLRGVDFSVSVGSRVPRELRVYRMPAEVAEIVPQYRDYRFMVVEKEILIVEPSANKIVTILPRDPVVTTATATTVAPATSPATVAPTVAAPVAVAPAVVAPIAAAPPVVAPIAVAPPAVAPAAVAPAIAAPTSPAPTTSTPTTTTSTTAATSTSTTAAPAPSTSSTSTPDQPSTQSSQAAEPDRAKVKKQASRSQRISRAARDDWRAAHAEVRVGQRVPDNVQLYDLPPSLYRAAPAPREARDYRYRSYVTGSRGRTVYQEAN